MHERQPTAELPKQINLLNLPEVKEQFANVAHMPELSNFILGAAYCGNGWLPLTGGLTDSRNRLRVEQMGLIILDALQQLISIVNKAVASNTVTKQELYHLLFATLDLNDMCKSKDIRIPRMSSRLDDFRIPHAVAIIVEQWGKAIWKEDWQRASNHTNNFWVLELIRSGNLVLANPEYVGEDFVGHCLCSIQQHKDKLPQSVFRPWVDINDLREFWSQHRKPTRWERLTKRVPKSPYVFPN